VTSRIREIVDFFRCRRENKQSLEFFLRFAYVFQRRQLELELIQTQTQMTQKPMLWAEVYARALRASQNRKEDSF